jgi:aspartyl-tRNA(Asn)/glutamyl-tRNA(Gln) amidotransferase subunit B
LAPFHLSSEYINTLAASLPALPNTLKKEWKEKYSLSDYDVEQLAENKQEADFFVHWLKLTDQYKAAANWILGPIRAYLHETGKSYEDVTFHLTGLSTLLDLVATNTLSFSVASGKVFKALLEEGKEPLAYATTHNLIQNNSTEAIASWIEEVLANNQDKVTEYKKGKKGLMGLFVGEVKKMSKGKADPKITTQLLEEKLK